MNHENKAEYIKFKPRNRRLVGNDQVWFGRDHILLVESTGISETYKRFFFKDIQAIHTRKTKTGLISSIVLGLLFSAVLLTGIWSGIHAGGILKPLPVIFSIAAAILLFFFLRQLVRGASCNCFIYSSVQKEMIRPIKFIKTAKRFLNIIIPQIEAAQGTLAPEELAGHPQRVEAPESAVLKHVQKQTPKKIPLTWHALLFFSLLGLSGFAVGDILFRSPVLYLVGSILFLVCLLLNITAVVRQVNSTLLPVVKGISITSLVFMVLALGYGYVEFIFLITQNMEKWVQSANTHWDMAQYYAQINLLDYPILLWTNIFLAASFFILGILGLLFLLRQKR